MYMHKPEQDYIFPDVNAIEKDQSPFLYREQPFQANLQIVDHRATNCFRAGTEV